MGPRKLSKRPAAAPAAADASQDDAPAAQNKRPKPNAKQTARQPRRPEPIDWSKWAEESDEDFGVGASQDLTGFQGADAGGEQLFEDDMSGLYDSNNSASDDEKHKPVEKQPDEPVEKSPDESEEEQPDESVEKQPDESREKQPDESVVKKEGEPAGPAVQCSS